MQLTSYCLRSGLGQWLAVLGQYTGGIGYSGLSGAVSILTALVGAHSLVLLILFTFFPSLFTFPLESPVFIGISRGEERAQLFTLSSPTLHLLLPIIRRVKGGEEWVKRQNVSSPV